MREKKEGDEKPRKDRAVVDEEIRGKWEGGKVRGEIEGGKRHEREAEEERQGRSEG